MDSPPPKPAGETLQFMQRLLDLVHALDVRSKRMAKTLGVTGPQRLVIRVLGQSPGMTASDIAGTLGMHPSTLTGVLKRLEDHGLLARRADPADGRRALLRLTPRGRDVDRLRDGTVEAAVRRTLRRLTPATARSTRDAAIALSTELEKLGG